MYRHSSALHLVLAQEKSWYNQRKRRYLITFCTQKRQEQAPTSLKLEQACSISKHTYIRPP